MRKVALACSVALLALTIAGPAWADDDDDDDRGHRGAMEALSAKPSYVTGGDVLVAVDVPRSVSLSRVEIELNGDDVTARSRRPRTTRAGSSASSPGCGSAGTS